MYHYTSSTSFSCTALAAFFLKMVLTLHSCTYNVLHTSCTCTCINEALLFSFCSSEWIERSECLPAVTISLSALTQSALTDPIIWRGSLYIKERRREANPQTIEVFGVKLSLGDSITSIDEDVCINATHHPSHLEVVQFIDRDASLLMWLTDVQLQLYPHTIACNV